MSLKRRRSSVRLVAAEAYPHLTFRLASRGENVDAYVQARRQMEKRRD